MTTSIKLDRVKMENPDPWLLIRCNKIMESNGMDSLPGPYQEAYLQTLYARVAAHEDSCGAPPEDDNKRSRNDDSDKMQTDE